MIDPFRLHLHGSVGCCGGLYCRYDRPNPTSSAGARRLRDAKTRSRRSARRVTVSTVRRDFDRNPF